MSSFSNAEIALRATSALGGGLPKTGLDQSFVLQTVQRRVKSTTRWCPARAFSDNRTNSDAIGCVSQPEDGNEDGVFKLSQCRETRHNAYNVGYFPRNVKDFGPRRWKEERIDSNRRSAW